MVLKSFVQDFARAHSLRSEQFQNLEIVSGPAGDYNTPINRRLIGDMRQYKCIVYHICHTSATFAIYAPGTGRDSEFVYQDVVYALPSHIADAVRAVRAVQMDKFMRDYVVQSWPRSK